MAKAFSEKEKDLIRQQLKDRGIELFGTYGIKRTNIEDLTKAVGIARGSFYIFYNSKEEFFIELLDEVEQKIKSELILEIQSFHGNTKDSFKSFLKKYITNILESNPILKIMINHSEEFEALLRKLPEGRFEQHTKNDKHSVDEFIKTFKDRGILINIDSELFTAILRGIILFNLHKTAIGETLFPAVLDLIISGLAEILIEN